MKQKYFIFIAFVSIFILGCQDDDFQFNYDANTTIPSTSQLSFLIQRSLQNQTTKDNFIDGSSAVKIEFPYVVQINNQSFNLAEEADYQNVITFLEDENAIVYNADFSFPLQASLVNFETITIQNASDFETALANAVKTSEINCIEFTYPLELNSFQLSDANSTTRILSNQAQFYNYLELLKQEEGFYEFNYPISISVDGQATGVNNVADIESIFNALAESCLEPNLYAPSTTPIEQLNEFLIDETFFVLELFDDGQDETLDVDEFRFTFNADGSISILNTDNQSSSLGNWNIEEDDNQIKLDLSFEDVDLEELVEDWVVEELSNNNQLLLTDEQDRLIFEKIE